ncbi:MAG: response regulator [Anaerolineae bacterium]|nr:response regulator [Anaerolineae bacterium]NUQ03963.1 response regulator [Anaerolineae bacterium]
MNHIPDNLLDGWEILIVDDEPDSLEVASVILDAYGATVHEAGDGAEALALMKRTRPMLVISDLSMPVMDGWRFLNAIRDDVDLMYTPVIALTAHAMPGDAQRALEAGFNNYLTKPLTVETFMENLVLVLMQIPILAEHINI